MEEQMLSAAAVANEFLKLQSEDPHSPGLDQMKLQKLVYYAHAWYLAIKGTPLFDDDIEAWPWGPVVRNLYIEFKDFKSKPISGRRAQILLKDEGSDQSDWRIITPYPTDEGVKEFIRNVWESHKNFTGVQLSNATHAEGEPWFIVNKFKNGNLDEKPKIENDLIKSIFRSKLKLNDTNSLAAE
jgi:uncharacterized phage-associated protein